MADIGFCGEGAKRDEVSIPPSLSSLPHFPYPFHLSPALSIPYPLPSTTSLLYFRPFPPPFLPLPIPRGCDCPARNKAGERVWQVAAICRSTVCSGGERHHCDILNLRNVSHVFSRGQEGLAIAHPGPSLNPLRTAMANTSATNHNNTTDDLHWRRAFYRENGAQISLPEKRAGKIL